ncbi:MAG: OmpA family protein [Spirochaetes bacterium]|nr:OmpA family protein [Spirochaetota bacterium]
MRKIILTALAVLSTLFPAAPQSMSMGARIQARAAAREALLETKNAVRAKQFEKARVYVQKAHDLNPTDSEVIKYYRQLAAPELSIEPEAEIFFYNKKPSLTCTFRTDGKGAGTAWITSWTFTVKSESGTAVRTMSGTASVDSISWDGYSDAKTRVPDGRYTLEADIGGELGFRVPVKGNAVLVLGKDMEGFIAIKETLFPAGKTNVLIELMYPDRTRIVSWEVIIANNSGKTVRSIKGSGPLPESVNWDGRDNAGDIVPGGDIFTVMLTGTDKAGKTWESNKDIIESEIEIITAGGLLTFKMSTLQFDIGKAVIQTRSYPLLDRVVRILNKYNWYTIQIEGHTDNVGADAANMTLSKDRAKTVMDYLISKSGLPAERFTTTGAGSSKPVAPNTSDAGRAKNRRVEFTLTEIKK